jgi:hypothetical protein
MPASSPPIKSDQVNKHSPERQVVNQQQPPESIGMEQPILSQDLQAALSNSGKTRPETILRLQRLAGNRSVAGLLQRKLVVGPAEDPYEQEADRIAQQVMSTSSSPVQRLDNEDEELPVQARPLGVTITPLVQRQDEEEELPLQSKLLVQRMDEEEEPLQAKPLLQRLDEEEEVIQAKEATGKNAFSVDTNFESHLAGQKGRGQPLPGDTRSIMENRFGADFSGVRLHMDGEAARLNRAVSAQAFTHGQDIYMGEGKSNLTSNDGQKLIAHELVHVVQQSGGAVAKPDLSTPKTGRLQRFADYLPTADKILNEAPSGFKFGSQSTYARIMAVVGEYHKLGKNELFDQLEHIERIEKLIKAWENNHGEAVTGPVPKFFGKAEAKRRNALAELKINLALEKAEVTDQKTKASGNQTLVAGTAAVNPEVDHGIIPKTAPVQVKKGTTYSGDLHFGDDVVQDFDGGFVATDGKQYLHFKIDSDEYIVLKSNVRLGGYAEKKDVLFPTDPDISDIVQGGLGDCYLLAAITSLVKKDPTKIREIMRDNGKTVTVQMHDIDTSKNPYEFKARAITVEKSVAVLSGKTLYARGALWVQILEKAYAAAGYTGKYPSQTGKSTMRGIAGGWEHVAMGHLIGQEGSFTLLEPKSLAEVPGAAAPALPPGVGVKEWELIQKNTQAMLAKELKTGEVPFPYVESFEQYFTSDLGKAHPFGVRKKVFEWISQNGLYQHEPGTGRYTDVQKQEFDNIVALLKAGKLVNLSSRQKIAEGEAGKGHSGGESKMMGLAGGHAYTVLDYGYGDADAPKHVLPKGTKNEARWLKLRNPWGSYGRQYEWDSKAKRWAPLKSGTGKTEDTEKLHEARGGVFWLELGDMTRNFHNVKMA